MIDIELYKENNEEVPDFIFGKARKNDKIWSVVIPGTMGEQLFSFDKKIIYSFWKDFPQKLTKEQLEIFCKERACLAELKGF